MRRRSEVEGRGPVVRQHLQPGQRGDHPDLEGLQELPAGPRLALQPCGARTMRQLTRFQVWPPQNMPPKAQP